MLIMVGALGFITLSFDVKLWQLSLVGTDNSVNLGR